MGQVLGLSSFLRYSPNSSMIVSHLFSAAALLPSLNSAAFRLVCMLSGSLSPLPRVR